MILTRPSAVIEGMNRPHDGLDMLVRIEKAGRTCYKSEGKSGLAPYESAIKFVKGILSSGHESVIEHGSVTARFICDRGVTHEMVRHRICAFSQESTRYCNYKGGVEFIIPPWLPDVKEGEYPQGLTPGEDRGFGTDDLAYGWYWACMNAEASYLALIEGGWTPQKARSVLPNSLKTEIVVTANLREWRHIFRLRAINKRAHPQIREAMLPLLAEMKGQIPVIFEDLIEQ